MYRRNRYYDPATGRFTQEDPVGLAGGMNLYGFASGDPVNFSDPFGLCPGKRRSGTICISFFIRTWTTAGGLLAGDGRDFGSLTKPGQSRAYVIVDPSWPEGSNPVVNPTCSGSRSVCGGPVNTNRFSVSSDGSGGFNVRVSITNALLPGPSIDASLHFFQNSDGGWDVSGTRDGYPSLEAYYYGKDGNVHSIIQQAEGRPRSLWGCCDTQVE
jgi:uncharacterized protein RhaS with RHS repeats